jgi:hypothetical protein
MEDGKREDLDGITTVTLVHVISKQTVNMNLIMIFRVKNIKIFPHNILMIFPRKVYYIRKQ